MTVIGILLGGIAMQQLEITDKERHLFRRKGQHGLGRGKDVGVYGIKIDIEVIDKFIRQEQKIAVKLLPLPVNRFEHTLRSHENNRVRRHFYRVKVDCNLNGAFDTYYHRMPVEPACHRGIEIGRVGCYMRQDIVLPQMTVIV